jgi:hypothetical protein
MRYVEIESADASGNVLKLNEIRLNNPIKIQRLRG